MSYDVSFFQLAPGITFEEINAFFQSDAYERYMDEGEENDKWPMIPERFVNTRLSEDDLRLILQKPLLDATVPPEERNEELERFLASDETEPPGKWADYAEMMFEWSGDPGTQPFSLSYSENLQDHLSGLAKALKALEPQRIALYDPQCNQVFMGGHTIGLQESAEESTSWFRRLIKEITGK